MSAGTLALGAGGGLAATAVTVASGATFGANPGLTGGATGATNSVGAAAVTLGAGSAFSMADGITSTLNLAGTAAFTGGTGSTATFDMRMSNNAIASALVANSNLNVTGGTLTLAGNIVKGLSTGAGTATLTLNGGTLDLGNNLIGSAAAPISALNFQSGTLQNVAEINGGAALVKSTAGTLALSGTNAHTGVTNVTAGTLLASGTNTGTGAVTVSSGAVLGGSGSLAAPVTVSSGGTLTAGNGVPAGVPNVAFTTGTLTVNNAVSLQSGSLFAWKITGLGASLQDLLSVTGGTNTLTSGTASVRVIEPGGSGSVALDVNQSYSFTLATTAGTPSVAGLSAPTAADHQTYAPDFYAYATTVGNTITITSDSNNVYLTLTSAAVPEPTTVGRLAAAGLGLGGLVRRRRTK